MVTQQHPNTHGVDEDEQRITAEHLYNAECALHAAHQSHVDAWIAAASNRLHEALSEYLAAEAARRSRRPAAPSRGGIGTRRSRSSQPAARRRAAERNAARHSSLSCLGSCLLGACLVS
jgi:hypothetical protein